MTDVIVWSILGTVGVAVLAAVELVRSGTFSTPKWENISTAVFSVLLLVLGLTAGVLAVTWAIVVIFWEIWEVILMAVGVLAGVVALLALYLRLRSV